METSNNNENITTMILPHALELIFDDDVNTRKSCVSLISDMLKKFDSSIFTSIIPVLITYICSLTTKEEMEGALDFHNAANKKFKIKTSGLFYGLFGRTLRYLNPFEIGLVLSERTGRVTSAFSVIVGEYLLLSRNKTVLTIKGEPIRQITPAQQIIQPVEILSLAIGGLDKGVADPKVKEKVLEAEESGAAAAAAEARAAAAAAGSGGTGGPPAGDPPTGGGRTRRRR
jgi:hypothetical protein